MYFKKIPIPAETSCKSFLLHTQHKNDVSTLNLTAVGRFAHTIFKGLFLKKSLSAKNWQKIPNPLKTSAESNSWVVNPSKNVNLCLFYASEQAKA